MSFKDGIQYEFDHQFTNEELGEITPEIIVRWMCLKVYGNPNPGQNDNPTQGRSSALAYAKKAISYFMPNKLMPWNELANPPIGNPTKSIPVNELIKRVKKKEVRKQGKESQARKPFTEEEYEFVIRKMDTYDGGDNEVRLLVSSIFRLQMALIGRIDDASKLLSENLKANQQHPMYSILCKLCWSKNVNDERDAPDQILLGAQNPSYCVLMSLSTWLEHFISQGHMSVTNFAFGIDGQTNPELIKERASNFMKQIINDEEFINIVVDGKRGTHSIRKMTTTRARRHGCSKDEVGTRARWKRQRQQDSYADTILPWPDAKVAAALCKGGPIHYHVKEDSGITEDWILLFVVPSIASKYCRAFTLVLGRALLWRVFDEEQQALVPAIICTRVKNSYRDIGNRCRLPDGENPVEKVPLIITGTDAELHIEVLIDDDMDHTEANGTRPRRLDVEQMRHMNTLLVNLRRDNTELRAEVARIHERHERLLMTMNRNLIHLMRNPLVGRVQRQQNNRDVEDGIAIAGVIEQQANSALLSKSPRTLHTLWNEYEFGLANRKAAKDFTAAERGLVKYTYHRRKVLWDKVAEMVRSGWSANEACNRIYEVYGENLSVTQILNLMRKDRTNGGHPLLRMVQS